MEEMEVRTEDLEVVETNDKEANGSSGIGVGLAMLIGSGLTLAAIAGGKKLINLWADHKARNRTKGKLMMVGKVPITRRFPFFIL